MPLSDDLSWWENFRAADSYRRLQDRPVAYFCAEFALTPSLKTYSGGLGVLAGDILREAADQRLPMVGVGLLYHSIGKTVKQYDSETVISKSVNSKPVAGVTDIPSYRSTDYRSTVSPFHCPTDLEPVIAAGAPLTVRVPIQDRYVTVAAYRYPSTSGRGWWSGGVRAAPVYLLTTDCPGNDPRDRRITDRLYPQDKEKRLQQEIILGLGGLRLLEALAIHPSIYHLNEGHSAFLALEIIRHEMSERLIGFDDALELARRHIVFTNHTLVPAGQDIFSNDMVAANLVKYAEELAVPVDRLVDLGLVQESSLFSMTMLSLRLAGKINAVSQLHAAKAGEIWKDHPMEGITNGVHLATWDKIGISEKSAKSAKISSNQIMDKPDKSDSDLSDLSIIRSGPPQAGRADLSRDSDFSDIWQSHLLNKRLLLNKIHQAAGLSWPDDCLLIGWARRFVVYKRPLSIFYDPAWLAAICTRPGRQVRLVISGAAHPGDAEGEKLLAELKNLLMNCQSFAATMPVSSSGSDRRDRLTIPASQTQPSNDSDTSLANATVSRLQNPASQPQPRNSLSDFAAFLPNYDMELSQLLTAGCDVWLNTPVVGFEACGTSGMKACLNGVLPISTKDGWMAELDQKNQLKSAHISYHQTTENSDKSDPIYPVYLQSDLSRFSRSQPTSSGIAGIGWLLDSDKVSDSLYKTLENQVIPLYFDHRPEWIKNMASARELILKNFTTTRVLKEYIEKLYLPLIS